ncbi:cysteine peptidase family C39 domain-containing protein [Pedobacter sp. UYP1]|uniref:cysteine peptidase family C39 domain-containing protein n=1 Tax=Pedobacter sp. UYP1 TaxID=1756396 RepID=UPI0033918AB2
MITNIFNNETSNIAGVTHQLLNSLKVKVNRSTLLASLESHPDYPSLLTISDSLREFKVDSHAYQIDKKTYNPSNFSFPFIAYVSTRGGIFILVHNIINGHVIVSDEKNKNQLILESEFSKLWGGVLLSATLRKES